MSISPSHAIGANHRDLPLPSLDFPVAASNVFDPASAKVIIFLVDHKKPNHYELIREYIKTNQSSCRCVLLVEGSQRVGEMNSLIPTICWEDKTILAETQKKAKSLLELRSPLREMSTPLFPLEKKIDGLRKIYSSALEFGQDPESLSLDDSCHRLNQNSSLETKTVEAWESLLSRTYEAFVNQTIQTTFAPRQTSLIEEIDKHLGSDKVFVSCGRLHGDPNLLNFPNDVERLLSFLRSSTSFVIFDLSEF